MAAAQTPRPTTLGAYSVPTVAPSHGRSHAAGGGVVVYLSRLYGAPEGPAPYASAPLWISLLEKAVAKSRSYCCRSRRSWRDPFIWCPSGLEFRRSPVTQLNQYCFLPGSSEVCA